jgi:hypothetical protein
MIDVLENRRLMSELGTLFSNIRRIDIGTPTEVKDYDEIAQYLDSSFTKDLPKLEEINVNVKINDKDSNQVNKKILKIIEHPLVINYRIEYDYESIAIISRKSIVQFFFINLLRRYDKYSNDLINIIDDTREKFGFEKGIFYSLSVFIYGDQLKILSKIEITTLVGTNITLLKLSSIREVKTDNPLGLREFLENDKFVNEGGMIKSIDFIASVFIDKYGLIERPEELFTYKGISEDTGKYEKRLYLVFPSIIKFSIALKDIGLVESWRHSFPNIKEFVFYNIEDYDLIDKYNEIYPEFIVSNKK